MKKIIYLIGVTAMIIVILHSCKKENPNNKLNATEFEYEVQSNIPYSSISKRDKGFKGTNGSSELLVFQNMDAIRLTLADLDRQVNELDSAFVSTYTSLSEDSLNAKEIEINFTERQPLINFNEFFLYSSLYQEIAQQELLWLDHDVLNEVTDPNNHFIFEQSLRAILNTDCEVQVGDTIYILQENGFIAIYDGSLKSLEKINQNPQIYTRLENVVFVGNDCNNCRADSCNSMKRNSGYKYSYDNNYRIKWVVSHWTHPWGRRVAAKTDNYKKQGNKWKDYRTACAAKVYGFISGTDGQCNTQLNFNPDDIYAAEVAKHIEHKIDVSTKTRPNWVKGYFSGCSIYHSKKLIW